MTKKRVAPTDDALEGEDFLRGFELVETPPPRLRSPFVPVSSLTREERYALEEGRRRQISLQIERIVFSLANLSIEELTDLTHKTGGDVLENAQRLDVQAENRLGPEFLKKYKKFAARSLDAGARGLLQLQFAGIDVVLEVAADSSYFQRQPPKKRSLIRLILENMFGVEADQ